eukprot:12138516-Prorocentrum_lima.AAC.1
MGPDLQPVLRAARTCLAFGRRRSRRRRMRCGRQSPPSTRLSPRSASSSSPIARPCATLF